MLDEYRFGFSHVLLDPDRLEYEFDRYNISCLQLQSCECADGELVSLLNLAPHLIYA
jgi:hypothetical protein